MNSTKTKSDPNVQRTPQDHRTALAWLAFLLATMWTPPLTGQTTSANTGHESRTLRTAVNHAVRTHPVIAAEKLKVQRAELDVQEVLNLKRPNVDLLFKTGLVPQAAGDIFDSPDTNEDLDNLGVFWRFDLNVIQPISTFGKISSARDTAESGVEVRRYGKQFTAAKLGFEVVQAYWGFESSNRGVNLSKNLLSDYKDLLEQVELAANDPQSDVDDTRLFEVQSFEYGITKARRTTHRDQEVAKTSLEVLLDWDDLDEKSFAPVATPAIPDTNMVDRLISMAMQQSPAIQQARAGLDALDSIIALSEASKWPDLFVALSGVYARAPNRTDIKSPFILDPFNLRTVGGFLGLRWNLKFADHRLEIAQSTTERDEATQQIATLEDRLTVEVTRAYAEAMAQSDLLTAAKRSAKAARRWLRLSGDNFELGLGSVDRLIKAYRQYYDLAAAAIEVEAKYHLALARLALTLGRIELYLDWTEHGSLEIG